MYTISLEEFLRLVAKRRMHSPDKQADTADDKPARDTFERQDKILRPDQRIRFGRRKNDGELATCPACDAVVDAEILDRQSGLCPVCHEEQRWRT